MLTKTTIPILLSNLLLSNVLSAASGGGLIADNTAGTTLTLQDQIIEITGGTTQGGNLLHSFREFNVETGQTADFQAAANTQNIISRVTGPNDSWIDGNIKSTTSNANLYLVNPNGIVMGENASLDVNGAFHASTADYVTLADGQRVYADANKDVTLTVAAPEAFGFLDANVGQIQIHGSQLRVAAGQAISLVGGEIDITSEAKLEAAGGGIDLVGVASAGEVALPKQEIIPSLPAQAATVRITDSTLQTDGPGGGRITVAGNQVLIGDSVLSARTQGEQDGRGISLQAQSELHLTRSLVDTHTTHTGAAGDIRVQAPEVVLDMRDTTGEVGLRTDSLATGLSVNFTLGLELEHTWLSDLAATLISPAGTELTLFRYVDGGENNLMEAIFADTATTPISADEAPFRGEFRPQEAFMSLRGEALDGDWQLRLADDASEDTGQLLHWSMQTLAQTFHATDLPQMINDNASVTSRLTVSGIGHKIGDVAAGTPGQAGAIQLQATQRLQVWRDRDQPQAILTAQSVKDATPGNIQVETPHLQVNGATTTDSRFRAESGVGHFYHLNILANSRADQVQRPEGPHYVIPADWGSVLGNHLYHHFSVLNLDAWESITFSGPDNIQHIIARVQGPASQIAGSLGSTIAGADLWLLNPAGILFGEHATLDLTGALHLSTADYLTLADHTRVTVDAVPNQLTSLAPPIGFGFLDADVGQIQITGSQLRVGEGETISLVGGEVTLESSAELQAIGGHIDLVAVDSAGEVQLTSSQIHNTTASADITFESSQVSVSNKTDSNTSGSIRAQGDKITASGSFLHADNNSGVDATTHDGLVLQAEAIEFSNSQITAVANSTGDGGPVLLQAAGQVVLDDSSIEITTRSEAADAGNGGNLKIAAPTITLTGDTNIFASTSGSGQSGSVRLQAADKVVLNNGSIFMGTYSKAIDAGNGGVLEIKAPMITLAESAWVTASTSGSGQGGSVRLQATDQVVLNDSFIGMETYSSAANAGKGGNLQIAAPTITLTGDTNIFASTSGSGQGGSVQLQATKQMLLNNSSISTGTYSKAIDAGNGGVLEIKAPTITLAEGAQINASTSGSGQGGSVQLQATDQVVLNHSTIDIKTTSKDENAGDSGNLKITAPTIALTKESKIISTTAGSGQGGSVQLQAASQVMIEGYLSQVDMRAYSVTKNAGEGGNLKITAPTITLSGYGRIYAATTGSAQGGSILLQATEQILLNNGFFIGLETVSKATNAGNGGNLDIKAPMITLAEYAKIRSTTSGNGQGGTIQLQATEHMTLNRSLIDMQTTSDAENAGKGGILKIEAPKITLNHEAKINATTTGSGQGGSAQLLATEQVILTNSDIHIETRGEAKHAGKGGNLEIVAPIVTLAEGTEISTATSGSGSGGNLEISASTITLMEDAMISATALNSGSGGSVQLQATDQVLLKNSDISIEARSKVANTGKSGELDIMAPTITLEEDSTITAKTSGGSQGGSIRIQAIDQVLMNNSGISMGTDYDSVDGGKGSNMEITAPTITLEENAYISAGTGGTGIGQSGSVRLQATDQVKLSRGSNINIVSFASTKGSHLEIKAPAIILAERAVLSAASGGQSQGGSISLRGADQVMMSNSNIWLIANHVSENPGKGGDLEITAPTITLEENAQISAATWGKGQGGSIRLVDADLIRLSGHNTRVSSSSHGMGAAGSMQIQANHLTLADGASIESTSGFNDPILEELGIDFSVPLTGTAGLIRIDLSGELRMGSNSQITTSTTGISTAGDIRIGEQIRPTVLFMTDGAQITSGSESDVNNAGAAGRLVILTSEQIQMQGNSALTTESENAGGGGIQVETRDLLHLQDSRIATSVRGGDGKGGDIQIDPVFVILENSQIQANAHGGAGGNITLVADYLMRSGPSVIEASSTLSTSGEIAVQAVDVDAGSLQTTTQVAPLHVAQWRQVPCHLRRGKTSRLIMAGYDAHPTAMADVLSSLPLYITLRQSYHTPRTGPIKSVAPQTKLMPPAAPLTMQHGYLLASTEADVGCMML